MPRTTLRTTVLLLLCTLIAPLPGLAAEDGGAAAARPRIDPAIRAALLIRETERSRSCVLGYRASPAPGLERFDTEYMAWARRCSGMALLQDAAEAACGISKVDQPVCHAMRRAETGTPFLVDGIEMRVVKDLDALTGVTDRSPWTPFTPLVARVHDTFGGGGTSARVRQGNLALRVAIGLAVESGYKAPKDAVRQLTRAGIHWTPGDRWVWPNLQFSTNLAQPIAGESGYALFVRGGGQDQPIWGGAAGDPVQGSVVLPPDALLALELGGSLVLAGLDGTVDAPRIAWRLDLPTEGLPEAIRAIRDYYANGLDADLANPPAPPADAVHGALGAAAHGGVPGMPATGSAPR